MDYEKFGIVITIAVLFCIFGFVAFGNFVEIPQIGSIIPIEEPNNAYFEWCYKMNIEC